MDVGTYSQLAGGTILYCFMEGQKLDFSVLSSVLCKVLGIGKKQLELSDTLVKPLQLNFLTLSHPGQINFGLWAGSSLISLC